MNGKIIGFLATVLLPIILFLLSPYWSAYFSDKKELSYEIVLKRQLTNLDSSEKTWPGIQISYQGVDVSTGSFLTLSITNSGKLPIKREDFDSPILIHIPEKESIVSFQSIFALPSNLDVTLSRVKEGLAVAPLLLNPGDRFVIEIFSRVPLEIADVSTRVVGLPKISRTQPEKQTGFNITLAPTLEFGKTTEKPISNIPAWVSFLLTHTMLIGSLLSITSFQYKKSLAEKALYLYFSLVLYVVAIISLKMTLTYFAEVLELNKTLSFTILMATTGLSVALAYFIRRAYFLTPSIRS
jgi:hypothetical protein